MTEYEISDLSMLLYRLDENKNPIPEPDTVAWGMWFATADRHLALTELENGFTVSTVFLGVDHAFPPMTDPVLWETAVIYPDGLIDPVDRYSSKAEAEKGHAKWCAQHTPVKGEIWAKDR